MAADTAWLAPLAGLHHAGIAAFDGGLIAALFLAGLAGSLGHCAGMCGPLAIAQAGARLCRIEPGPAFELRRLAGAALLPYHLGRLTTYATLGALAGTAMGGLIATTGFAWLAALLLAAAALAFALQAVRLLGLLPAAAGGGPPWSPALGRLAAPLALRPYGWRGYGLGLVLGLIPCGLLYAAVAAAGSSGSPVTGAAAMAAFGLGTAPMLTAIAFFGAVAAARARPLTRRLLPGILLLNALLLLGLAWSWLV